MGKMSLTAVAYVERAARLSRDLTRMKARGPGDTDNAMRAIERDYGIDYWTIWRLRYAAARLKDIPASIYARIEAAYIAECERQARRLNHEIAVARLVAPSAVDAADLVAGDEEPPPRVQPPIPEASEEPS